VINGIDVVGRLTAELQSPDLIYMAASPTASKQPLSAKELIDFLAAPAAAPVYKAKGISGAPFALAKSLLPMIS
jgi:ABC-type molybdate transport system substrate-binding protein